MKLQKNKTKNMKKQKNLKTYKNSQMSLLLYRRIQELDTEIRSH